jgi:hypothetical protein
MISVIALVKEWIIPDLENIITSYLSQMCDGTVHREDELCLTHCGTENNCNFMNEKEPFEMEIELILQT